VLAIGCGTGLDLPHLVDAVGTQGQVVGIDRSRHLLGAAGRKVAGAGWDNVRLRESDAADLDLAAESVDAVLFTYSLAIIDDWHAAWAEALRVLRPDGWVAVVDTDLPSGVGGVLPLGARFALWAGGVDRPRHVWELPATATDGVETRVLAAGHIRVSAGTFSPDGGSTTR